MRISRKPSRRSCGISGSRYVLAFSPDPDRRGFVPIEVRVRQRRVRVRAREGYTGPPLSLIAPREGNAGVHTGIARAAGGTRVPPTEKKRGDGLERRPPAGIAREREPVPVTERHANVRASLPLGPGSCDRSPRTSVRPTVETVLERGAACGGERWGCVTLATMRFLTARRAAFTGALVVLALVVVFAAIWLTTIPPPSGRRSSLRLPGTGPPRRRPERRRPARSVRRRVCAGGASLRGSGSRCAGGRQSGGATRGGGRCGRCWTRAGAVGRGGGR